MLSNRISEQLSLKSQLSTDHIDNISREIAEWVCLQQSESSSSFDAGNISVSVRIRNSQVNISHGPVQGIKNGVSVGGNAGFNFSLPLSE